MSNHTPGPWTASCYWDDGRWGVLTDDNKILCACNRGLLEPDARLIAAAPDLRDALEGLLAEVDAMTARTGWAGNGFREKARAALARCEL